MLRNKQLRAFIRLVLLIFLLDAMANALPAAFAMAKPSGYLNESTTLLSYFTRFLQFLLFHSVIYILFLWWVHPLVAVLYLAVVSVLKRTLLNSIGAGVAVSFTIYLLYAYNFSVDRFMDYFLYRVLWYSTLGGLFGWLYYKKNLRLSTAS
ncbi:hypothetical protein [Telluribacter humicola]|uniref:hypothetical protein n=1 Tax=Telluribacter humicola TaxID=1720261 RepID=UPI001A9671F4|nr:hypothetical protein [Telluribacter humicola]